MTQTAKRLDHIDIAKAIGLLLVIYGHTFRMSMRAAYPWCAFSYTFVYRFHVPLLFLLSGMGCTLTAQKNRSLSARQFVCKKAHSLLLPWGVYSAFLYLLLFLANLLPPVRALLSGSVYQLRQLRNISGWCCTMRTPMGFICGICPPFSGFRSRRGCWTKPCPQRQPGSKAGAGGGAARVLSAAFHRLVLGGEKLLSAGGFFLSGLRTPA